MSETDDIFSFVLVVVKWFEQLKDVLTKNNLFNRPDAIWNVDESEFTDDPSWKQFIVRRSTKNPISFHGDSVKSHTTVLMCTSESGEYDLKFSFILNTRFIVAGDCLHIWYIVVFVCTTFGVP